MLLREAQNVMLQVSIRHNYDLRDDLQEGRVDVIIGFVSDQEDDEFHCVTLLQDIVVIAVVKGHPIFHIRKPWLESLSGYRWVVAQLRGAELGRARPCDGTAQPTTAGGADRDEIDTADSPGGGGYRAADFCLGAYVARQWR